MRSPGAAHVYNGRSICGAPALRACRTPVHHALSRPPPAADWRVSFPHGSFAHHGHDPARRPPVLVGHAHGNRRHAPHLGRHRPRGVLVAGGLGRRHLRHLPALPRRKSLGSPAHHQEELPQDAAADAHARPKPRGLPPLLARHREPLHRGLAQKRHRGLSCVRRLERRAQRGRFGRGAQRLRRVV